MLKHISDDGHGWLMIPKTEYIKSGIKATHYSYQDENFVYLEEDVDAAEFVNWGLSSGHMNNTETEMLYNGQPIGYVRINGLSKIRNKQSIWPDWPCTCKGIPRRTKGR